MFIFTLELSLVHPGSTTGQRPMYTIGLMVLGASLAVSPWAICLRVDADQYLTTVVVVV